LQRIKELEQDQEAVRAQPTQRTRRHAACGPLLLKNGSYHQPKHSDFNRRFFRSEPDVRQLGQSAGGFYPVFICEIRG
jgi:hypothetical protein